jgi:hypothetical protein
MDRGFLADPGLPTGTEEQLAAGAGGAQRPSRRTRAVEAAFNKALRQA